MKLLFLTVSILLLCGISYVIVNDANAQTGDSTASSTVSPHCNCVVFRMDDANSDYLTNVQLGVMNQFISENQSLSLGLIMHRITPVSAVTEKLKEGKQMGLFELDIHGWDHVDYTQLSPEEQLGTLEQARDKMHAIFGQYSQVFIPPYNKFDGDIIGALKPIGVRIFSADTSTDRTYYFGSNTKNIVSSNTSLYHLPAMTTFKSDNGNGTWVKVPLPTIAKEMDYYVKKYGYAVILLHPQNFANMENNVFVDTVNESDMHDLSLLIDYIKSQNLKITTFEGVTGLNNIQDTSSNVQTIPEFHSIETIVMITSLSLAVGFTVRKYH